MFIEGSIGEFGSSANLDAWIHRSLAPEYRYATPNTHIATDEGLKNENEFSLNKVSNISLVINSPWEISGTTLVFASPGYHDDFDLCLTDNSIKTIHIALHY